MDFQGRLRFHDSEGSSEKSGMVAKLQALVVCCLLEVKPGVGSVGICPTESDCHYKTILQGDCFKADMK